MVLEAARFHLHCTASAVIISEGRSAVSSDRTTADAIRGAFRFKPLSFLYEQNDSVTDAPNNMIFFCVL